MRLLIESEEGQAYRSLYDDHPSRMPIFSIGDVVPVSVAILKRISQQWGANIFEAEDVSSYLIRIAIGGFALPDSGSFFLSYDLDETDLIYFNPAPDEIEERLNEIASVQDLGGLDVTGENGSFIITWRETGIRNLIGADASGLTPPSLIEIEEVTPGDVSTREVQSLRIRQNVGALATLSIDSDSPSISITLIVQGDATHNHKIRLSFPPDRWGGNWTFTAAGATSDLIPFAPGAEQIQAAIELVSSIGKGNVTVSQESENDFVIMFIAGRGNQAISGISADGTTLKVIGLKSGFLDLRGEPMEFLVPDEKDETLILLEVEATPTGGDPQKILRRDIILRRGVISHDVSSPTLIPGTFTLHNLTGFTGGGSTKVDGTPTLGKPLGTLFRGVVSNVLYEWELQAGTATSSAPGTIRPTDYNSGSNAVNLILVSS